MEAAGGPPPRPGGCPALWKGLPGDGRLLLLKALPTVKGVCVCGGGLFILE